MDWNRAGSWYWPRKSVWIRGWWVDPQKKASWMAIRGRAIHDAGSASLADLEVMIRWFDLGIETRWWHRFFIRGLRRDVIAGLSAWRL